MKVYLLFSVAVTLLLLSGCDSQKEATTTLFKSISTQDSCLVRDIHGKFWCSDQLFSGALQTLNPDSSQLQEHYVDGLKHGTSVLIARSGNTLESREYRDGLKHGTHKGWYETGQQRFEYEFHAGKHVGNYTTWFRSGKVYERKQFDINGKEMKVAVWRQDGTLVTNYTVKNGRKYGIAGSKSCVRYVNEKARI